MSVWLVAVLTTIAAVNGQSQYVVLQTVPPACRTSGTDRQTCYTLYGKTGDYGSTWQEAFDYCRTIGSQLAIIPNQSTQRMLGNFKTNRQTGNGHAWIAARRDADSNTWKNIMGEIVQGSEYEDQEKAYCAVLDTDKTHDVDGRIKSRKCYHSAKKAICQQQQQQGSFCDGYQTASYCYSLSPYYYSNWYEARKYCLTTGGDLAFASITSRQLIQSLGITNEVWIGVVKQPWMWFYADGSRKPLTFTSWRMFEGSGREELCAHIELNDNNNWSDKDCHLNSALFICQTGMTNTDKVTFASKGIPTITKESTPTTSSITTTDTNPTTTTSSTTTSSITTSATKSTTTTDPSNKTSFTYDDIFNGFYWPSGYYGQFSENDDSLIFTDSTGNIYKESLNNGAKRLILPYYILSSLKSWTYYVSPSFRYVLIGYNRTQTFRYSFTARYKIYDTETGSLYEFPNKAVLGGVLLQTARWGEGDKLSFVYRNNLYYQSNPLSDVVQVTSDGIPHYLTNGVPDWMYEEDIIWSNKAHYWSPNGRYLCFAKFNMTGIPLMKIPVYGPENQMYPDIMEFIYPKAGDIRNNNAGPTTTVQLFVIDTNRPSKAPIKVLPPPEFSTSDHYYTAVKWRDDVTVYAEWTNRAMNKSVAMFCTVDSIFPRCVRAHEVMATDAWVSIPAIKPTFINNAQYYLTILPKKVSGRGQWQHLAMVKVQNSGTTIPLLKVPVEIRFLTDGKQEITDIVGYDRKRQIVYFISTNGEPDERHLFSVGTAPMGPDVKCLTCEDDTCSYVDVSFSSSGKYYIQSCRGPGIPKYYLKSTDQKMFRVLETNEKVELRLSEKQLPSRLFVDIKLNDQFSGKGEILLPPNFSSNKKYRHLHYVYGAPDSQLVFKEYMAGGYRSNWFLHLASTYDIVITKMDGRGSYGNGDDMRHAIYKKLGVVDVEDQIKAMRYFQSLPWINSTANTAVIGWSFGGKTSALSLVDDSNIFQCGLAISPDTNTRYYNKAYSERYLGFANESIEAYDNTDVMLKADKFREKKLFLAHGTKDDNVHFVHYAQLVRALTDAGVQFKSMMYTDENHNLAQYSTIKHLYTSMTNFLINDCWAEG